MEPDLEDLLPVPPPPPGSFWDTVPPRTASPTGLRTYTATKVGVALHLDPHLDSVEIEMEINAAVRELRRTLLARDAVPVTEITVTLECMALPIVAGVTELPPGRTTVTVRRHR